MTERDLHGLKEQCLVLSVVDLILVKKKTFSLLFSHLNVHINDIRITFVIFGSYR
jgi:hypothetical protein